MATLIKIVACVTVFLASGFILSKDYTYNNRVAAIFKKLATLLYPEIG
jgi:hypothetical protein